MAIDDKRDLDALRPLVALLPELVADGASFGAFPSKASGVRPHFFMMFDFNDLGERFHAIGHTLNDGLTAADWEEWEREDSWATYLRDPARIASASARDVRRLVIRIVRHERFCDGAMQMALESGLVEAAVRRAAELLLGDEP